MRWLADVFTAIGEMLSLHVPHAFGDPGQGPVAVGVVMAAALSTVTGQAAVLRLNRIRGWRLVLSVLVAAWLAAALRVGLAFALAFAFAMAPYVFGFLIFLPDVGLGVSRLLEIWSLVCLIVMASSVLASVWLAVGVATGIWTVAARLISRAFTGLAGRVWTRLNGRSTITTGQDVLSGTPFIPVTVEETRR
ncbi:MAG: hypothetical protein ACK5LS_07500 [Propioniciclava sp.]